MYHLQHTDDGRVPTSLIHQVKDKSLDELYTPDVPFDSVFVQSSTPVWYEGTESTTLNIVERSYKLGGTTAESWNYGVFGPMLGHNPKQPWGWAGREQNTIAINLPLYVGAGANRFGDTPCKAAPPCMRTVPRSADSRRPDTASSTFRRTPSRSGCAARSRPGPRCPQRSYRTRCSSPARPVP